MTDERPGYRASLIQAQVRAMRRIPGGGGVRALDRCVDEVALVRETPRTDWIPAQASDRIGAEILREIGRDRYVMFWRTFAATVSHNPLFDILAKGALRLFGSPSGVFKMVPRAWNSVSRGVGTVEVDPDPAARRCIVRITGIPEASRTDAVVMSWEGSYLGVLDLVRVTGRIAVGRERLDEGVVEFSIDWDE